MSSQQPNPAQINEASKILSGIKATLIHQFQQNRTQSRNAGVKGSGYEIIFSAYFQTYLSSLFNFQERIKLIDYLLEYVNIFTNPSRNEWDVVATYNNAIPSIILPGHSLNDIPYDAVAFIAEVAQSLTRRQLTDDLTHYSQLNRMPICSRRFGMYQSGKYTILRPVKLLVYEDRTLSQNTISNILTQHTMNFDLLVVIKKDELYLSPNLPFANTITGTGPIKILQDNAILLAIISLLASIPISTVTNILSTFTNLYYAAHGQPIIP